MLLKGTCRTVITLKAISLTAIITLATRPLVFGNFTENLMSMFTVQILSVPAIIYQLETMTIEVIITELIYLIRPINLFIYILFKVFNITTKSSNLTQNFGTLEFGSIREIRNK